MVARQNIKETRNQMGVIIDATETAGYQMKEGDGPAACLTWDGNFSLILSKAKRNEKQAASGNTTISLQEIVQDTDFDGAKGALVYHSFPVTGKVEKGPNAGRANVGTLIDLCISAGRQDLADEIIGKRFDLDSLLSRLLGDGKSTLCYARLSQQEDDRGNMRSQPNFYIKQSKYDETRASGANFRVKPQSKARAKAGAPANGATGAGAHSSAHVSDQMNQEV